MFMKLRQCCVILLVKRKKEVFQTSEKLKMYASRYDILQKQG